VSTSWLARAFGALLLVLVLARCASPPRASTPRENAAATSIALSWPGWSPSVAITTCRAAIDEARRTPPTLEKASGLMVTCASLVGGPECRDITEKQWGPEPAPTFGDAVAVCGKEYCPRLADATTLAACRTRRTDEAFDPAAAWVLLRQSMLLHDFPESELPNAARALNESTDYVRSVPPPALTSSESSPPEIEVRLNPDGALTVLRGGREVATVASAEELKTALPRPSGDTRATLRAPTDAAYERVIGVINALRDLGYVHVSFAAAR
jgi:biopolymer transport protein ExbD